MIPQILTMISRFRSNSEVVIIYPENPIKIPLNHHFPMVFPWFSQILFTVFHHLFRGSDPASPSARACRAAAPAAAPSAAGCERPGRCGENPRRGKSEISGILWDFNGILMGFNGIQWDLMGF